MKSVWKIRGRTHDLSRRAWVMGVLNATPDSFSDGGAYASADDAVRAGLRMVAEGADVLDVGGESTRPGALPVAAGEEMGRVLPVIRGLRAAGGDFLISVDTSKALVAEAALAEGADIVNDVTGLRGDERMASAVARSGAGAVVMHMRGTPADMQRAPHYGDVTAEVGDFFRQAVARAVGCGVDPMSIAIDPGIGFGKTPEHSRTLLRALPAFAALGRPVLVGLSRKSFLGWIAGSPRIEGRLLPGVALACFCRERGARVFRVHDVTPHREALRATEAMLGDE